MNLKYLYAIIVVFLISKNINPQNSNLLTYDRNVVLNYSLTHVVFSENVQDSFYIYVKLPKNYDEENKKLYPVIYLLDGDIAFPIAWSVVRYLQFERILPDVIIVGIGYGGLIYGSKISKRERDYTFSHIERWSESGAAQNFLRFLKSELIPYLKSNYRMDSDNFTISGHSIGGLFALYTLFSEPLLFKNYIASSPHTSFDLDELLSLEEKNQSKIENANCNLFISFGENEDEEKYFIPNNKIINHLRRRCSDYINLKFRIFEEGIHFSTPAEAMAYGLMHAFK